MASDQIDLTGPTPREWGWVRWDWLCALYEPSDPGAPPQHSGCSVPTCGTAPAVAARRSTGTAMPGYWQPYCTKHAQARGIEVTPTGLAWSERFRAFQEARSAKR
ncbi:MAG: hypothetical protein QOE99_477 [Actinomycetota bacterium]|nr:hypothetical protein [Actinomycetota bacterium]